MKNEITFNGYTGNALTILEGKALDPKYPNKIQITGFIDSVNKYLGARKGAELSKDSFQAIDKDKAIIVVDDEEMNIHLFVEPNSPFGTEIIGQLEFDSFLNEFNINKPKEFTREALIKLFRFNRRFFEDKGKHEELVNAYQKLNISSAAQIKNETDTRGNKDLAFKKTINSDSIPTEFILEMPIFKGQKTEKFRVEICLDSTEASVRFWFESVELAELIQTRKQEIFKAQLADYLDYAIIWQ